MTENRPLPPPAPVSPVSAYQRWQAAEGLPVITGLAVEDLSAVELAPWPRTGGLAAFINLYGTGGLNDIHLCKIPAGSSLEPQRHLYEEVIYVLEGHGTAEVWYDQDSKFDFEWGEGSLFAVPLNAWYQFHNVSASSQVLYVACTTAPIMMDLIHNLDFIFANPFRFTDRFSGEERDYFTSERDHNLGYRGWSTNLIPDVRKFPQELWTERGAGGTYLSFDLANSTLCAHIADFPPFTYKKSHRHGPGAHLLILDGVGYSLMWPEGARRNPVPWKKNSLFVPPQQWWHQHFNTGGAPASYLALRWNGRIHAFDPSGYGSPLGPHSETNSEGRAQIEYEDEDPQIHADFERELDSSGSVCQMGSLVPTCTSRP